MVRLYTALPRYNRDGRETNKHTFSLCCVKDVTIFPSERSHNPTVKSADALAKTFLEIKPSECTIFADCAFTRQSHEENMSVKCISPFNPTFI